MPLISGQASVAANTTSGNLIEGSSFEFLEQDSLVTLMAVTNSAASTDIQALFQIGGITLIQPPFGLVFAPATLVGEAPIPNALYHNMIQRLSPAGSRLFLTFQNTGSAARTINWAVRIDGQ